MGKTRFKIKETTVEDVDNKTGEVTRHVNSMSVEKVDVEPFFFTYSKEILALYGKPIFNATTQVLWKLLEFAEYNTGKVYMTAERVAEIMETCHISKASYYRALSDLKKVGIIEGKRNTLTFAENMFWKGDRDARHKLMKARGFRAIYQPIYDEDVKD